MFRFIFALILATYISYSQEPNLEVVLEQFGNESEQSELLNEIEELLLQPILLDIDKPEETNKLIFLSQFQIDIVNDALKKNKFTKEYLLSTGSFRDYEVDLLLLCVKIPAEKDATSQFRLNYRARSANKLMKIRGFEPDENKGNQKYEGRNIDFYQKFTSSYLSDNTNISAGFLSDRDAGERLVFDYYSAYGNYKYKEIDLIVGDYYPKRGSGLILASGFAPRKGKEVIAPIANSYRDNRPYTSTLEARRLRGIAGKYDDIRLFGEVTLGLDFFYSNQMKSGNIKENEDGSYISSVYQTAYYRSDTEIAKKNAFREIAAGGGLELDFDYFRFGASLLYLGYSMPIYSSSASNFYGKHGMLKSLQFSSDHWDNFKLSGEYAFDSENNSAFTFGALAKTDFAQFALNIRDFSKQFRSPFSNAFGEFSYPSNERGIYLAFSTTRYYNIKFSAYLDLFASQDSTYYVPGKVTGNDFLTNLEYRLGQSSYLNLLYKREVKTDYGLVPGKTDKDFYDANKQRIKLEFSKEYNFVGQTLRLKSGLEYTNFNIPLEIAEGGGFFISTFLISEYGIDLGLSVAKFATDDYESAIWYYEYALPGYSNTISLYLKGYRISGYLSYMLSDFKLSLRYSYLEKPDELTLSSGWDETFQPIDRRIYLQFEYNLK